ncbi:MAG: cupin domain-containing protein [Solirubrobacteraceae bacterium]
MAKDPIKGEGWAVASIDDLGDGPGFRKVRQALDVTEFGVNGVVLPPGYTSRRHFHDRQQELYMVLRGEIEFELDGAKQTLGPGGLARVDAPTVRSLRNTSETDDAVYLCVGGQGGYVGRDGQVP